MKFTEAEQSTEKFKDALDKQNHELNQLEILELKRYVVKHQRPGSFVQAIIENDLDGACAASDLRGRRRLFEYVLWLVNNAPAQCWGSPSKYKEWLLK